jgi:hypothetical protein
LERSDANPHALSPKQNPAKIPSPVTKVIDPDPACANLNYILTRKVIAKAQA